MTGLAGLVTLLFPLITKADGLATAIHGLQGTLDNVYSQMLPMCSQLIGYIAARVYRQIASAEPIDFYPLMRPFALGLAIMLFPTVIAVINDVMQPALNGRTA